jgi:EAL domain-containing protein (putative c-di-GMP-specific phosphodiesterase class I)
MSRAARDALGRWQRMSRTALTRVEVIALFPIMVLAAYALGGAEMVLAAAMVLPSLLALQAMGPKTDHASPLSPAITDHAIQSPDRATLLAMLERIGAMPDMESACFVLEVDDWNTVERRIGTETARDLRDECQKRLRAGLGAPILVGETSLRLTACVGHAALAACGAASAEETITGATRALEEAKSAGPGSVRAFVAGTSGKQRTPSHLTEEVPAALASGAILAWFQPQIDMRTGAVAGFEALARWDHATLGLLGPGQFLASAENAGRIEEMGTRIRQLALEALHAWDAAGHVPLTVSVNACESELRNHSYAEQVAWDLDAAGIAPERLIIEVLESVAADAGDDAIMATLAALRSQGIGLDLDDFGVGQASLLSIRRFGVGRIKIDRSFVTGIDRDTEQQAMVGGIVSLGRTMGLEALAEGVETPQEEAALTQLGCTYVQGFGIAKPMPLSDTLKWLENRTSLAAGATTPQRRLHSAE